MSAQEENTATFKAQVNVSGTVIEKENNSPLTGASVIVKGPDGKIKKFASSKSNGGFEMAVPSVDGCLLEISMMGFARQSIPLDSVSFPLSVFLESGTTLLKEVTVKADKIREQGDTITYNVGSFAQAQDRSIGDVLKRMPGINVESSGKIQYQGEDINKFYIEGSDLLGGKYGIATNGISHSIYFGTAALRRLHYIFLHLCEKRLTDAYCEQQHRQDPRLHAWKRQCQRFVQPSRIPSHI